MENNTILIAFGQPLTRFGLLCAAAVLAGLVVCGIMMRCGRGNYGQWIRLCVCVIPCVWLFARLLYSFADWIMMPLEATILDLNTGRNPLDVVYFWRGGYSLMGGVLGAIIGAWICGKWIRCRKGFLTDALALGLPVAILIERLAEHGTGLGQGDYVTSPWLISTGLCPQVYGDYVHPVYLYEAAVSLIILVILSAQAKRKMRHAPGMLLESFLLLFGLTQVVLESLRADGHMVEHFVHIQQVYAIFFVVGVLIRRSIHMKRAPGRGRKLALCWLAVFAAAGLGIWSEFGVDRWGKPLLAYGLMCLCMLAIGLVAIYLGRQRDNQ